MLIGAYYYPWYGKAAYPVSGGGDWKSGYANNPVLGEYNNRDQKVIKQHLEWAKEAGIDFLLMNWVGIESQKDITLKEYILPILKDSKIKFCLHYDSSVALNHLKPTNWPSYDFEETFAFRKTKGEKFLEDMDYLADNYFNHPSYFEIEGQPFLVMYNVSAFRNNKLYFEKLKESMKKRNNFLFLVADVVYWSGLKFSKNSLKFLWETSPQKSLQTIYNALRRIFPQSYETDFKLTEHFKGITGYNLYNTNRMSNFLENVDNLYEKFKNYAGSQSLYFIPNVMPGYNDKNLNGQDRPVLERDVGNFYKEFWEIAKKHIDPKLQIMIITSFNEWHEGTEIEPSKEFGNKYLELTKSLKEQN